MGFVGLGRNVTGLAIALAALAVISLGYAFHYRYYLRIVPVPEWAVGMLYGDGAPAPDLDFLGRIDFPQFDITEPAGLRAALIHIRSMSPLSSTDRLQYNDITFEGWLAQLRAKSMYCTDATALFLALAEQQGIAAREWWLWSSDDYEGGDAHSVAEFYNPKTGSWHLVDPLTATTVLLGDGSPASYADVLAMEPLRLDSPRRYARSEFNEAYTAGQLRTATTPVLNLKPPAWLAETAITDLVVAYAVLRDDSDHSDHVYLTKLAVLLGLAAMGVLLIVMARASSRREFAR